VIFDGVDQVGEAEHARLVVDVEKSMERKTYDA